jgi:hypothetical protein
MEVKLVLDRFENDQAVLISEEKEAIFWPRVKLPDGIKEGAVLYFDIRSDQDEKKTRQKTAKDILNEILDTKD